MREDWSREEVEVTVADYFAMWAGELAHERVNKREHNRALQAVLNDRSAGAIEFKHQNISAVLVELGLPYLDGYKPRFNLQGLLREVIAARLATDGSLDAAAAVAVTEPAQMPDSPATWQDVLVSAPAPDRDRRLLYERRAPGTTIARGVNYLEREARNASLGAAGEEFVLLLEHARLWERGERRLADRIEHVARVQGDGLGYDILSFEPDGRERLIEVKTTRFGIMTPFFASRNEVAFSEVAPGNYHLYRLFKFRDAPKLFILPGSLTQSVILDPVVFRASLP